jgi:competence protein ComEC
MLTLVLSGHYFSRDGDFLTSVALAALLIVGFDPVVIDEAGFQLSFTAVLLLCTFEPFYSKKVYPLIRDRLGKIPAPLVSRLGITLFASLVVGVGMLPLVAYHFNRVSFVFPIANLFVVPVLSFMLAAGIACLLAGLLWIKAAMLFGLAAEALSWTIFGVVRLCSIIPGGSTYTASPPIHLLGLEALAIALIWWRPLSIRKVAICLTLAALVVGVSLSTEPRQGVLRATFLEVGDADACLIEFPNGDTMLIDTGFATSGLDCGEDIIAPFLWKRGITSIDTLVLTHPDSDHTGGALFLIEAFRIGRLWAPEAAAATPGYDKVFAAMSERGIPVERLAAGSEPARFGEVLIETLNPPPAGAQAGRSDNDLSLALRLTHGETSLLMGGDAESKAARFMTGSGKELQSDVLKASHHGLRSGFNRRFVEMVNPRIVVISGKPHRSGQNIEERIERYSPLCETVFSTSSHGAITIESDGQDISAVFERKAYRNLF